MMYSQKIQILALLLLSLVAWSRDGMCLAQDQEPPSNAGLGTQATEDTAVDKSQEAEPITQASVRRVLRQLEAATVKERDAAEAKLVAMGPEVLPFLPDVDANTSGEMKTRLQRIRQAAQSSEVESYFEATKISISGKFDLEDALEQIEEQTNNIITLQGEDAVSGVEVELDYSEAPFWTVVGAIMTQANLRINAFGSTDGDLVLAPGGRNGPPVFETGPFRVEPLFVQATKQFNSQLDGQLQVSLQVTWEPRLEPVFMQIPMNSIAAKVSDSELSATNPQAAPEIPLNYGGSSTQIDLQVERPMRTADQLDSLEGEFVIAVPGESHKYKFTNFGNGARQSQEYGDVRVTLEGARRNGRVYEMRVLVEFANAQGALDSFRGWILSNKAYLLGTGERRLENLGLNTYAVSNNAVGIAYLFQINGDPNDFTLVYESPATITRQTVKYALEDIPLP